MLLVEKVISQLSALLCYCLVSVTVWTVWQNIKKMY